MKRRVPYAVANYEEIVRDQYYFVDKTRFIHDIELYKIPFFLRPRRFGKSLWCSILECYYDINRKDRFEELFGHTDIGRNPTAARNSHLVMRFDFSQVEVKPDVAHIERSFNHVVRAAVRMFAVHYRNFQDFSDAEQQPAASDAMISILSRIHFGIPPVNIIIDEYDNFTNQLRTTHQNSLYAELTTGDSFLRTFFKVIKAGVGEGAVARVFVTGVLPVTMDDLTSGFNIGQIITLKEHTLEMMGFTQAEMDHYLDEIVADYGWPEVLKQRVRDDLRSHYNGYRLLPGAKETLYNSTIANFYLNDLVIGEGRIPTETIDHNLRTDINWLRRLCGGDKDARELVETLMFDGALTVDSAMLGSKFNMHQFFELCTRYLSPDFMFAIEVNRASGRSDWEAIGRAGTPFENQAAIIEFKHYPCEKAASIGVAGWTEPPAEAVEQVSAYAADLNRGYPELTISRHVICTIGAADYRFFTVR